MCPLIRVTRPEAVKMAISRLRQHFSEQLSLAVVETLGPDDDLGEEMQHLRSIAGAR